MIARSCRTSRHAAVSSKNMFILNYYNQGKVSDSDSQADWGLLKFSKKNF